MVAINSSDNVVEVETTLLESGAFGIDDVVLVELRVSDVDGELVAVTPAFIEDVVAIDTSDDVLEMETTVLKSGGFGVDDVILVELRVSEVDREVFADALSDIEGLVAIDASDDVVEVETTLLVSGAFGIEDVVVVELRVSEVGGELVGDTVVDIEGVEATDTSDDVVEVETTLLESGAFGVDDAVLVEGRVSEDEVASVTSDDVIEVETTILESGVFGVEDVVLVESRVSEDDVVEVETTLLESGVFGVDNVVLAELRVSEVDGELVADTDIEGLVAIDTSNDVVRVETTVLECGAFGVDDVLLAKLRVPEVDGELVADKLVDIEDIASDVIGDSLDDAVKDDVIKSIR